MPSCNHGKIVCSIKAIIVYVQLLLFFWVELTSSQQIYTNRNRRKKRKNVMVTARSSTNAHFSGFCLYGLVIWCAQPCGLLPNQCGMLSLQYSTTFSCTAMRWIDVYSYAICSCKQVKWCILRAHQIIMWHNHKKILVFHHLAMECLSWNRGKKGKSIDPSIYVSIHYQNQSKSKRFVQIFLVYFRF